MNLPDMDQMNREWMAWTEGVVPALRKRGIEVNDETHQQLVAAIHWWGEELAELRRGQDPQVTAMALDEKREAYEVA